VSARVPILVLRETTERPELIAAGAGKLVGTDADRLCREFLALQHDRDLYERMRKARNPFGDGHAAARIVDVLLRDLPALRPAPAPALAPAPVAAVETAEAGMS